MSNRTASWVSHNYITSNLTHYYNPFRIPLFQLQNYLDIDPCKYLILKEPTLTGASVTPTSNICMLYLCLAEAGSSCMMFKTQFH
jgi:hypothetical protein